MENQSVLSSYYLLNRSRASIHTSTNEAYGKVVGTKTRPTLILTSTNKAYGEVVGKTTGPSQIPISTNKAYGKLRVRGGTHTTNVARGEGEEGYELVDVRRRESPPPPQGSELEGMYEVPLAPVCPSHPLPTSRRPTAGDEEDTVYEVIP